MAVYLGESGDVMHRILLVNTLLSSITVAAFIFAGFVLTGRFVPAIATLLVIPTATLGYVIVVTAVTRTKRKTERERR